MPVDHCRRDVLSFPLLPAINSIQFMLWNTEISQEDGRATKPSDFPEKMYRNSSVLVLFGQQLLDPSKEKKALPRRLPSALVAPDILTLNHKAISS